LQLSENYGFIPFRTHQPGLSPPRLAAAGTARNRGRWHTGSHSEAGFKGNGSVIGLLITLLIYMLVLGLVWWVITLIPLPQPFGRIAQVVVLVLGIVLLLSLLLGVVGAPRVAIP
jgi:hypothetical protein